MTQNSKIDSLEIQIRDLLEQCRHEFSSLPAERFRHRKEEGRWTAEECFAHLNALMELNFPKIEKAMHKAKAMQWAPTENLKTSWKGQKMLKKVSPTQPIRPRKAKKKYNFLQRAGRRDEYKSFLINLEILLRIIRQSRNLDISRTQVKVGWWWFSKVRLHELFQYFIDHALRHLVQIRQVIS